MSETELFDRALRANPDERAALFDRECANDPALRARLEKLLAADADVAVTALGDGSATAAFDPAPSATTPGMIIAGKYKLLERIGEGGMGEVWVADQSEPIKRRVALKLIKPGMDSRSVLGRFEAERQALAVMDHPNIAKVLDAGTTADGRPYFVMELVKGTPITEFCDARKLTPKQRLELFVPVCQAIQHAHMKGIIHRDIKPSNVLVALHDETPVPKVIDFGVAKAIGQQLTEKTIYTGFGALIGTPAYMAPEQATFNQLDVDTRADVYALGVLLYELLAGSPPIEQARMKKAALDEVLRMVRDEEPPRPSHRLSTSQAKASIAATRQTDPLKLSALMKGELDWIVMKALEKDRTRRYDTANGLAKDVQRYLSGEQVQAVPPSLGYRLRKAYRRNTAAVWVAAAFAGLVTLAGLTAGYLAVRAETARRGEVAERRKAEDREAEANEQRARAEREQQRAEEEKRAAEAVRAFLQDDLLRQADIMTQANALPLGGGEFEIKPNPTIRELLDRAAAQLTPGRIEAKFPGMPFVQAEVLHAVASAYGGVGEEERGRPLIDLAVELYRTVRGDFDPATFKARKSQLQLSTALPQDRFDAMASSYLEDATRAFGPRDRMVLEGRLTRASGPLMRKKPADSIPALMTLRSELTESLGPTDALTLMCGGYLATAYQNNRQYALAVREIETLRDTAKGMAVRFDHPLFQQGNILLADSYRAARKIDKATEVYEDILDGWKRRGQTYHVNTWQPRHLLAWVYARNGNLPKGAELFEANVTAAPSSFNAFLSLNALCDAEAKLGRDDHALVVRARQALTAAIGNRGATYQNWVTGWARIRLGQFLIRTKEYAEAEAMLTAGLREMIAEYSHVRDYAMVAIPEGYRSLLDLFRTTNRANTKTDWLVVPPETFDTLIEKTLAADGLTTNAVTLVEIRIIDHIAAGRHDEALAYYRDRGAKSKPVNKLAADAWLRLSGTVMNDYEAKLRPDRMKPWAELRVPTLERNLDALRKTKPDELSLLRATNSLAFSYLHAGRYADVIKLAVEAIARQTANGWRTDADTVTSYGSMTKAVARAGRADLAVKLSSAVLAAVTTAKAPPAVLASATFDVGFARSHDGDHAAAEGHFREAVRLQTQADAKHWKAAKFRAWLGVALHDQKKYADAEPLLREAYAEWTERVTAAPAWEQHHELLLARRLAGLYEATKKPVEAKKWAALGESK
jgi:serine/threonine protein kinase